MFWGLIMEPNKRYSQVVEKAFHISQAALDHSTGDNEPCQVMVIVDGKNFLICTLQKNKIIQVPLDMYFNTGSNISFLINGKCNVHLTGYLDPDYDDQPSDEEEEEDEEEDEKVPELVPSSKTKRKLDNSNDVSTSKKAKKEKKPVAEDSSDEDEDGENQLQKLLDGDDIDSDENDDSFKMNTSAEASDSDEDEEDSDEEEEAEEEEEDSDEEQESKETDTTLDSSTEGKKLSRSARRRLKKQQAAQEAKEKPQINGVAKKEKQDSPTKADKKKEKKEAQAQVQAGDKKEKKSLSGGVFIEDLKVGNGPVAKAGKTIMVYYEGRLKQNNKMFDNCQKGPGFKFRLGAKEVISGWDVGVAGMKVGGKRRIVCPPNMAYGAKGSPPVIPSNSTLVFDVELKNVK